MFWVSAYAYLAICTSNHFELSATSTGMSVLAACLAGWMHKASRESLSLTQYPAGPLHTTLSRSDRAEALAGWVADMSRSVRFRTLIHALWGLASGKISKKKKKIVRVLRECTAAELNYVLCHLNLPRLLSCAGSGALLQLLLVDRAPEYCGLTRGVVIDACEKVFVQWLAGTQWAEAVGDMLCSSSAVQLYVIKAVLDSGGDHHNFYKLVYSYLSTVPGMKSRVLQHLASAEQHSSMNDCGSAEQQQAQVLQLVQGKGLKILADIDDTFLCSGGVFPAGVDRRLPKKEVYPGVLQLLKEIDVGCSPASGREVIVELASAQIDLKAVHSPETTLGELLAWAEDTLGMDPEAQRLRCSEGRVSLSNLVLLSARPHLYKGLTESFSYTLLRKLREQGRLHTEPTLLPGCVHAGMSAVLGSWGQGSSSGHWSAVGRAKFETYVEYTALYPECKGFVFFGDNGQGDLLALERMAEHSGRRLKAGFIHVVQPMSSMLTSRALDTEAARREWWRVRRIVFFENYVDAALAALGFGLISTAGLRKVCVATRRDFLKLAAKRREFDWRANSQWEGVNRDLARAGEVLGERLELIDEGLLRMTGTNTFKKEE
eukprot:TRINITY_DN8182_c0_g1_i1.p1 TRINITY_DN8182_c0_g1~~TRINITY_DN8182_c0_g1_i1.p1  ORF type:complete len:603 (-),score=192.63 TRINITY_DN8182_c0_g1_i1:35-1843(-)